jgi:hypothetical protein
MALADYGDSFLAYDLAKLLIFYVYEFHKIKRGIYSERNYKGVWEWMIFTQNLERFGINSTRG